MAAATGGAPKDSLTQVISMDQAGLNDAHEDATSIATAGTKPDTPDGSMSGVDKATLGKGTRRGSGDDPSVFLGNMPADSCGGATRRSSRAVVRRWQAHGATVKPLGR